MNPTRTLQLRRRVQRGGAARGVLVAAAVVAAVALQLAGPQLQCRLATMVGITRLAPSTYPVEAPMHRVKVAQVLALANCPGHTPAI